MHDLLITRLLLAADDQRQASQPAIMVFIVVVIVAYIFIVMRPTARDRKLKEDLLNNLKKNDRVLTSGGIIGSVAMVSQDGKEITLKVDDNTRIKFLRSYIISILGDEKKDDTEKKS